MESNFFNYTPAVLSILSLFLLFYLNFFSFSILISRLPPQSTEIGANHHPRLPPVNHPRHKHLKISKPTTPNRHRQVTYATNTSRSTTPQPHPRLHHHAEIGANNHTPTEIGEQTQAKTPDGTPTQPPQELQKTHTQKIQNTCKNTNPTTARTPANHHHRNNHAPITKFSTS